MVKDGSLPILKGPQAKATDPLRDVWLSASAGTGKTHVLSSRVFRLLLTGVKPEAILCLTFTKSGAAEMAARIHERLGAWVQMPGPMLATDLAALGEDVGPESIAKARTLFARVLDARGGGLRIQTIHSFCQSLLTGVPAEAGLNPGFRPIEAREEALLSHHVLADMVAGAVRGGALGLVERLQQLAIRLGEDRTRAFLRRCAAVQGTMEALGPGIAARVRVWLGLRDMDVAAYVEQQCCDDGFDLPALEHMAVVFRAWKTKTGIEYADLITAWLAKTVAGRVDDIAELNKIWAKTNGEPREQSDRLAKIDPDFPAIADEMFAHFSGTILVRSKYELASVISDALVVGQHYARDYAQAKRVAGLVDFNDLIRNTVALLATPGMGDWIRYKMDQSTDHILVDEAQDTNADQWAIIESLTDEFYVGKGAKDGRTRTIFTVGDYKQAIFGFQGTNPEEMTLAKWRFSRREQAVNRPHLSLSLSQSFRSSPAVLDVVDAVIETVGPDQFGLAEAVPRHESGIGGSGRVTLWKPFTGLDECDADDAGDASDEGDGSEENWVSDSERRFAGDLARKIKDWTSGSLIRPSTGKSVQPGDILILVRARGAIAKLIVARLYEAGVAVAGVDRLRLNTPIVVQDLLACVRFALQPEDDLNLAALLVSPLVGWSQDQLYDCANGRTAKSLWQHLGDNKPAELLAILTMADMTTPYRFLEEILSGPICGRRRIIVRLGEEARDPINELLNAALTFEANTTPSLQLFLDWFDRGDVEIKRDASGPGDAVRVMTVHGAKGLQAPVVILADATSDPDNKHATDLDWVVEENMVVPLFRPKKDEIFGSLQASADAAALRERQEHWRLLYVAMTRAEELLFIGGAMKPRQQNKGELGPDCWHTRIGAALMAMGQDADADGTRAYVYVDPKQKKRIGKGEKGPVNAAVPDWAYQHAREEARPPRPLAPSAIGVTDDSTSPPPSLERVAAANRGILLHALFERLPNVQPDQRDDLAKQWLRQSAGVTDATLRAALITEALSIINDDRFAPLFTPDALPEAPLSGVVNGQVIAGTVDRLLVGKQDILVVDFKTGRRVPSAIEKIPRYHMAQMGAYAAVLRLIFPDHDVRAALLYTSGPALFELSQDVLASHKPGFLVQQQNLDVAD